MSTELIGEGEERPTVREATQTNGRGEDRGSDDGLLIPHIPNDITVNHIIPKLLSLFSPVLSLVSAAWRKAIQSQEVYNARARSRSTETLVAISHRFDQYLNRIALYSMRDRKCYPLPPIPGFKCEFPWSCECISLDRKLYVIGGEGDFYLDWDDNDEKERGVEVHALDLAGSSLKWKRCADMKNPRRDFGYGVKDGKIYVIGGTKGYDGDPMCESEVYDPKTNSWSSIPPMKTSRLPRHVATVGEELVVYGACGYLRYNEHASICDLEFYHPGRNEWRLVEGFGRLDLDRMFVASEKFYAMSSDGIYVHDGNIETHSWTEMHSFSLPPVEPFSNSGPYWDSDYNSCPVLPVNGELFTICYFPNSPTDGWGDFCYVQSKGFGSKNKELVWENAKCSTYLSLEGYDCTSPVLCPIVL